MKNTNTISLKINEQIREISGDKAFMPLASFLRNDESLPGTKVVCAEGDCGACTVLLAKDVGEDGKLKFLPVNSCILPLYLVNGAQVVTVEGIAKTKGMNIDLHEVQQKMVDCNGAQCGYCTPGFICSMVGAVEKIKSENKTITEKKAKNYLTGNLCRCTGYLPIIDAMTSIDLNQVTLLKDRYHSDEWIKKVKSIKSQSVIMSLGNKKIYLPTTLEEALKLKEEDHSIKLIGGSTDVGVVVNKGKIETPKTMALYHIPALKKITSDESYINVGATVSLSEFENYIETHDIEMAKILRIFASPQIKNQATLIGNVVNASPIADTIPFLMVSDALVQLESIHGKREVVLSNFFLGYKKLELKPNEIVTGIKIPRLKKNEYSKLYKVSMRKDLDISAVTFAARIQVDDKRVMTDVKLALGGVAATVIRLPQIESQMKGVKFDPILFEKVSLDLDKIVSPLSDLRATKEYRLLVAKNFFKKCALEMGRSL